MKPRIRIDATTIHELAERAVFIRARANQDVDIEFNGFIIEINAETTREEIVASYFTQLEDMAA